MKITQFTLEEVRCFSDLQRVEIRPLTFLVGENSTGKTTTLGCFQILANILSDQEIDFNRYPYSMGIFRDIVRRSKKSEKQFTLGFKFENGKEHIRCSLKFVERKGQLEPAIESATVKLADGEIVLQSRENLEAPFVLVSFTENPSKFLVDVDSGILSRNDPFFLLRYLSRGRIEGTEEDRKPLEKFLEGKLEDRKSFLGRGFDSAISVFSTSPVRSRPKRTYDPTREYDDPEGSDIPMRLMRYEATESRIWEGLKQKLEKFGQISGLFQSINVNNLGRSMGAPFQLRVKVRGPNSNIMDVGYGVSQVLPILVQVLNVPFLGSRPRGISRMAYFLLQQPEVHLHPRAQAELSSLLAQLANKGRQSFIIETHSDYMIDRARIEIRKGNIKADDVSLIYIEPKKNVVKVHNISFDKMGNLLGTPPHFREFFLRESSRLLGFEE